jgi:hypothetical protein
MTETPEEVLGSMREDAAVARRLGHEHDAKLLEQTAARFAVVDRRVPHLDLGSRRPDPVGARAGLVPRALPRVGAAGLARWNPKRPRERQYRAIAVPIAPDADSVRADARRAAGE